MPALAGPSYNVNGKIFLHVEFETPSGAVGAGEGFYITTEEAPEPGKRL